MDAAKAISRGSVSPRELVEGCLDLIESSDPTLRAFNYVDHDRALGAADRLTEEASNRGVRGPLHGIPVAVKDVIDVEGLPTTASSRLLQGNVAEKDAPVVASIKRAGGVIVGKTNLDEFAYGVFSPPTRNPWDGSRIPGGSSGGSAAALAAGMCLAALGTDTAGSIRIPAALCGVAGLKPRLGAIPMGGILPLSPSLDACGPMARDARDLSMMWEVMTGESVEAGAPDTRAGVADPESLELDEDVAVLYGVWLDSLYEAEGVTVQPVKAPKLDTWERQRGFVLMSEALEVHKERGFYPARASEYSTPVRASLDYAQGLTEEQVSIARRDVEGLSMEVEHLLEGLDVLVFPTTPCTAPSIQEVFSDAGSQRKWLRRLTRYAAAFNCCPVAAVSIQAGMSSEGLPWGIDVVGRSEPAVLAFASKVSAGLSSAPEPS